MLDVSVRAGVLKLLDGLREQRARDPDDHARPLDGGPLRRPNRRHVPGADRRGRDRRADVVRNPQHPYTKALLSVVPRRDPRDRQRASDPARRDAGRGGDPHRLPLPSALPGRGRAVFGGGSGARSTGVSRRRPSGGLHPSWRSAHKRPRPRSAWPVVAAPQRRRLNSRARRLSVLTSVAARGTAGLIAPRRPSTSSRPDRQVEGDELGPGPRSTEGAVGRNRAVGVNRRLYRTPSR